MANQSESESESSDHHHHIVIVPTPGMGHLIPLIQLANQILHTQTNFTISFVIPTEGPPSKAQRAAVSGLPSGRADASFLPPVNLDDVPHDAKIETRIALTLARSIPALRTRLQELARTRHLAVLVSDLFATDAFDVCPEFGLKPYIFFPSNSLCLSLFLHLPELDDQVTCEYRDMAEPVTFPGCVPIHGRDWLDPVQDRKNDAYKWTLHITNKYKLAEGILVNSFVELEEGAFKALQHPEPGLPPVYPVGPLVRCGSGEGVDGAECLRWLDEQPRGSVLFVSFGSAGTLSSDQLLELAHGLEMSEQRFLWVVKSPNDQKSNATYFNANLVEKDPFDFLPKGFLQRTKGRGLVISSWVPQVEVLGHESTGGFLTHCGWNSTLESIVNGVPLIAWPLFAEQKMNTVLLTENLKVALRPVAGENGLIPRGEITMVVNGLMVGEEGKEIHNRMKDLKDAAARVLSKDGSSAKALDEVALKWKSQ